MEQPSPFGELTISLDLPPVSQQARADSKLAFKAKLQEITLRYAFLLAGDVSISVEWSVAEQDRYETDRTPDVDNILKPLLDALVGPNGLLIDDNQVQHVSCHWIDSYSGEERVSITVRHSPDEWLKKEGLFFVQLDGGLCIPLSRGMQHEFQRKIVDLYENAIAVRNKAMADGIGYYKTRYIMPAQRVFHRTRLAEFEVIKVEDFNGLGVA